MADTTSVSLQRVRTSGDVTPSWWISQSAATNHHTEQDACGTTTVAIDDGAVLPSDGSRIRIKSGSLITIGTSMQFLLFDPMCASADGALLSTKSQTAQQQQQRLTPRMSTGSDLASATERLLASRVREAAAAQRWLHHVQHVLDSNVARRVARSRLAHCLAFPAAAWRCDSAADDGRARQRHRTAATGPDCAHGD
jgi:hypothetical protein